MKKIIFIISFVIGLTSTTFSQNNHFQRLDNSEILANESYDAVAYNFVYSIIFRDYETAKTLISPTSYEDVFGGDSEFVNIMESGNIHDIIEMRNVIPFGYLPVITYSGDELDISRFYNDNETNPYAGIPAVNVRFDCVNVMGEFYDDKYGAYDTNVRVMMIFENNGWKVFSFK